jgi:hypothetical protein
MDKIKLNEDGLLNCPTCGGDYLHHSTVIVYTRDREDGESEIIVAGKGHNPAQQIFLNPSGRRNGIAIKVFCENCDFDGELTIAQHKGSTFMEWRYG